jgi:hypothetical protein
MFCTDLDPRICTLPLMNGSGCGPPAPGHAFFVSDLQDANKIYFLLYVLFSFLIKVHLHHSSKIKSHKEVAKQ